MKLNMLPLSSVLGLGLFLGMGPSTASKVEAEETNVEKIENKVDEAKTKANRTGRKIKKKVRDETGNHSTVEDIKDKARNVGDSTEDAAKKIKRKVD